MKNANCVAVIVSICCTFTQTTAALFYHICAESTDVSKLHGFADQDMYIAKLILFDILYIISSLGEKLFS